MVQTVSMGLLQDPTLFHARELAGLNVVMAAFVYMRYLRRSLRSFLPLPLLLVLLYFLPLLLVFCFVFCFCFFTFSSFSLFIRTF